MFEKSDRPGTEGNERARDEEGDVGFHNDNLYDQDETLHGGEKTDPATGEKIDNSTDTGMESLNTCELPSIGEDVLGDLPKEKDEAEKWLKENDPDR